MSRLLHKLKLVDGKGGIEERAIWAVPKSEKQPQGIRYRLAYVPAGQRFPAVLYDNHYPKAITNILADYRSRTTLLALKGFWKTSSATLGL